MSILAELNSIIGGIDIPVETGVFSGVAPNIYAVLTPLSDSFELFGDNYPLIDISEVRISIFSKTNYLEIVRVIVSDLLNADFTITSRKYNGYDTDTTYHLYTIDVAKYYSYRED
jgi:hypothetical protein